jgi:hypothetical protein
MGASNNHDTSLSHPRRQSPPMRVGVNYTKPNNTIKYVVTGIFAALAFIVCSVTIYLWIKYRRRVNYKTSKSNEEQDQTYKLDDQLPQNPTPGTNAKADYGGKGGHDAGPEQEQGLLANAADPGLAPGPSGSRPYSHSNSSFHSAASTPPRVSYDSKGQRISSSHDPNCPVHSSHHGQPCPVHSHQGAASGSGLRPSSHMPPPATTYNIAAAPPTNPNFYVAQQAQAQRSQQSRPQSTPKLNSPPPQYVSRPPTVQGGQSSNTPPASLVPGPPTTPRQQHQFSNPYNHNRRPSSTNQLLPLYLASKAGGQADSYFDANNQLETPIVMNAQQGVMQKPRELSLDGRGRERSMSGDTITGLTPLTPGGRNRERRLSIGVPIIARTKSGRRQQSVDSRRTPMWADERGRLSVLQQEGVGRERPRGRSMSPRRSFELEGDSGDVGESLLGRQYRA